MNTKRQTVWLVSMLSLMVILSAYYLFTEDVGSKADLLTENTQQQQPAGATEVAVGEGGIVVDSVVDSEKENSTNTATESAKDNDGDAGKADHSSTEKEDTDADAAAQAAKEDQEVLRQIEAQGMASSIFNQIQYKRDQQFKAENNRLYGVISDTKQDPQTATKAVEELDLLEEKTAMITSVEEELSKQFNQAIVSVEPNDKYKVVVQSNKMEKSEADGIVQLVMKELDLTADQVSVQFVP